jgi:hypothetical protein
MVSITLQRSKKAFGFFVLTLFIFSSFLIFNQNAEAQPELFENGSFETGDFTGWTVVQEQFSGGDWFVYSGTTTPISSDTILPPPFGTFAAVTDQGDPSSQVLFQDIDVPAGTTECSVIVYYDNGNNGFINGPDLSALMGQNQQARIDIMDPAAPDFDIGAGVLENLFQTNPGDPNSLGYTTIDFDLTDFAGTTVRFRVAEVDNLGVFNFSIDNVRCEDIVSTVPTLSEWGLIAMASILGIVGFMVMRGRKVTA